MTFTRASYAFVLSIVITLNTMLPAPVTYIALYAVIIAPVLSLILTFYFKFRIRMTQKIDRENPTRGEKIKMTVTMKNRDIFPYPHVALALPSNLRADELYEQGKQLLMCTLMPFQKLPVDFNITCTHRGVFEIRLFKAYVYDYFGLFRFKVKVPPADVITVYPKVTPFEELPVHPGVSNDNVTNNILSGGDPTEILYIDPYQPMDNMRQIHWKLSSKRGELMVKRFGSPPEDSVLVALDLSAVQGLPEDAALSIQDSIIETALSIIEYCTRAHIICVLNYISNGFVTYKCTNRADLNHAIAALAEVNFCSDITCAKLINMAIGDNLESASLITVTYGIDDELAAGVNAGYGSVLENVMLWVFSSGKYSPAEGLEKTRQNALEFERKGMKVFNIDCESY